MPFTIGGEWIPEKNEERVKKTQRPVKVIKERRGLSTVTLILNLPLTVEEMKQLCTFFKQRLGCGGSVKENKIEIQGDKIQQIKDLLKQKGYKS